MLKQVRLFTIAAVLIGISDLSFAEKTKGLENSSNKTAGPKDLAADCAPPSTSIQLDLNNVRTLVHSGGDMWGNLSTNIAAYEVPKDGGVHALYRGSLWMGGVDVNNQLKVAAIQFRQTGYDFWPGPLNTTTAEIDPATCSEYDRFFQITRTEVDEFVAWYLCTNDPDCDEATEYAGYSIPASILNWPAHGDISMGQDYNLAPYYDADGSGNYNPEDGGDYPYYDLNPTEFNCLLEREVKLFGDETLWWVFNDKGNIHTETGANPIGMEIRGQAFAFSTNDEINDMTFYNYELINRGSFTLTNTYFAQWVDPDLGYSQDDYVGCDVRRGLGYCYNGFAIDGTGGPQQYGANPPAVGVDFFQGPYQDNDGMDNPLYTNCEVAQAISEGGIVYGGIGVGYGDGRVDNERFGMRRFVYHNNSGQGNQATQDPRTGADYYNYMRGIWKDGSPMCYGQNGHPSGGCDVGTLSGYMFPGDSDPCGWGTGGTPQPIWTEQTSNNVPFDRRFMQSAGPFTLEPGAVNDITVGVVWARASNSTDPFESVEKVRVVDDKAQSLFDNCFVLIDGPDAPELGIVELDKELILTLSNPSSSNNANEDYAQIDPFIPPAFSGDGRNVFRFEGYQIFQLKNSSVSSSELTNPDVARLVAQCDIENTDSTTGASISQLINFTFSDELNASIPVEMVNGANDGLQHSFKITQDQFATTDRALVNHKKYYYMAVAYSYNNYKPYDQNDPLQLDGQKNPYLAGRKNAFGGAIVPVIGIPHKTEPEQEGTVLAAAYGDGPRLKRIEGQGNGGRDLSLVRQSIRDILASSTGRIDTITYEYGQGPVDIKVINPKNLPNADFVFKMHDSTDVNDLSDAYWSLQCIGDGCPDVQAFTDNTVWSSKSLGLSNGNEQLIPEWGLSVFVEQTIDPGDEASGNGFIDGRISYSGSKFWLTGIPDVDGTSPLNWIRSGTLVDQNVPANSDYVGDDEQVYETVLNGTWAPYKLASHRDSVMSPSWDKFKALVKLSELASVDIEITADQDKWTRCPVLEIGDDYVPRIGDAQRFNLRMSPSVGKDGKPDGSGTTGMGWFPGFAINVETGERLNMAFGENSWLQQSNGADMIWNPTTEVFDGNFDPDLATPFVNPIFGGGHYIYVFGHNGDSPNDDVPAYDQGAFIYSKLSENNFDPSTTSKRRIFKDAMWVGVPLLAPNSNLLENVVNINLRVTKPYRQSYAPGWAAGQPENDNLPMYTFSTGDFATVRGDNPTAENALDLIRAVPNPYYAHSGYEDTQLDNVVKIINLPQTCTVSIYSVNGILVRQFKKDSPITSLDWDLNNHMRIPVASGVYLIHVDAPGIGEKVIKWFGTVRQLDLNSF
ncbi:MAG: T9SS type A sorting domain-containing protein [Flavobacteriales bacterium]|nr:T9SS type A sorting domain-containing protein [Flavobacteriales bacterium]